MAIIKYKKDLWNSPKIIKDDQGQPLLRRSGTPHFIYEPDPTILNLTAQPASEAKKAIYSNPGLQNIRWSVQPGVSSIEQPVSDVRRAEIKDGYHYKLQDAGPHFGVSAKIISVNEKAELTFKVTNNYIRHLSIFTSFVAGDGKTLIKLPETEWAKQLRGTTADIYNAWFKELLTAGLILLGDETHRFVGNVGAEMTFMGVPVSSSSQHFTYQIPIDQYSISKIRILCGSLGVESGIDGDPIAAWIGLVMTSVIDLAIPTFSLIATVGTESNELFDEIFKDIKFLAPTAYSLYTVIKDLIDDSPELGNDVQSFLSSLGDRLVSKVLTAPDVALKLAAYFGAEEAEEAIPVVGWALKVLAIEATIEQLIQTVCEVVTSPRVVEFNITVTMDAVITLKPDMSGHPQAQPMFAETAHTYTITAQYSDLTSHDFSGDIADPKVQEINAHLHDIPVGGNVTFIVAIYSREGHLVGKGMTAPMPNSITEGKGALVASISVKELLYPLNTDTRYQHEHILQYKSDGYAWQRTDKSPEETVRDLGTGAQGHVLEKLAGITLNADVSIVAHAWQASGLNIPSIDSAVKDVQLFAFQNASYGVNPNAGYMFTPEGYDEPPKLAYMRTMAKDGNQSAFFYVDPTGDASSGYHLRQIVPVTDPNIPLDSAKRLFDLSRNTSWGRFNILPSSVALHSNGYVVAVADGNPTLQILRLPQDGLPNDKAPWTHIVAGPGVREGMLDDPRLVAIAPNQTILVLERGNHRIQAFSRGGHPVRAFIDTDSKFWTPLQNPKDVTYLSMTVEVKGFIYVLYHEGNGYEIDQFYLDIYAPTGKRIINQKGLNTGSITVDLWRNLFAQNYQTAFGPGHRTEPSVSEYRPRTPVPADKRMEETNEITSQEWQSLGDWELSAHGLGKLTAYSYEFNPTMYASGFVIVGVGSPVRFSWDKWNLYADLKKRILAIRSAAMYHKAHWYLNSHSNKPGEAISLWSASSKYSSNSRGNEQLFQLYNLGKGNVAFKALGGSFQGQFITAEKSGWYPVNWKLGTGTVTFKQVSNPGTAQTFAVAGFHLPILLLTNSARECNLSNENLAGLDLTNADFTSAILHQTKFKGAKTINDAQFEKAQLQGAILDGLNLSDAAGFEHADFSGTDLTRIAASPNAKLNHARFLKRANLTGVKLTGAQLKYADLSTAILDNVDLSGADLTGAVLDGASLIGTILTGAILRGTSFTSVDLTATVFDAKPDFARTPSHRTSFQKSTVPFAVISDDWSFLDLTEATITGIPTTIENLQAAHALLPVHLDLSGRILKKATFEGARLYWLQCRGANLLEANFRNARLKGAKMINANLSLVDFTDAYLLDETSGNSHQDNKPEAAVVSNAFLIDTCFDGAHCDGVDFSGCLFFTYAGYSVSQRASARGAQLNLANFDNAKLVRAVFDQAQLAGASFEMAVCVGTTFKGTELTPQMQPPHKGASMHKSDIRGANFSEANMDGLNMTDAIVSTESGHFSETYQDFDGAPIVLSFRYGSTTQGNTSSSTTCPDGSSGPCNF